VGGPASMRHYYGTVSSAARQRGAAPHREWKREVRPSSRREQRRRACCDVSASALRQWQRHRETCTKAAASPALPPPPAAPCAARPLAPLVRLRRRSAPPLEAAAGRRRRAAPLAWPRLSRAVPLTHKASYSPPASVAANDQIRLWKLNWYLMWKTPLTSNPHRWRKWLTGWFNCCTNSSLFED